MNSSLSSLFKIICLAMLLFGGGILHAQVQGTALLTGQTDHSGIAVIFTAFSTSGQTDTTYTQTNGAYSINLMAGVYDVRMQATNYQTIFYNQNQPLLLSGNETLMPVTLSSGMVKYVSGIVSGAWDRDTIYIANGDLTIPVGAALTIEEGTQAYFEPDFKMTIEGQLLAIGTDIDPILFSIQAINPGTNSWDGLHFTNLTQMSQLSHCIIEHTTNALSVVENTAVLTDPSVLRFKMNNSVIRHCSYGVVLDADRRIEIAENEVYDFDWYGIGFFGRSVGANEPGPYLIRCNKVHDGDYAGIYSLQTEANAYISGNEIYDIVNSYGIRYSRDGGSLTIENNVIRNVGRGIEDASYNNPPTAIIRNNVMLDNSIGFSLLSDDAVHFQMNTIVDNVYGILTYGTAFFEDFSYNLISENDTNYRFQTPLPFVGVPVTVNANGDSTDAYFNLDMDPLLGPDFFPTFGSPVYDAGDPSFLDIDGSTRDIGLSPDTISCWPPSALARQVYPGDANFDQIANVWDVLAIGVKYGQTGPVRPGANLNWSAQNALEWGDSLASGLDIKHVDCDGNGIIDAADTLAIVQNYSLTHNALKTTASGDVPLYMLMPTTQNPGDTLTIPIMLGKFDTLANDMYGMAFSMNYDSSLVEPNSVKMHFDMSWLGSDNVDMLSLYHDEFTEGKFEVGMVRTDGVEVSGYGQIATVIVVLDDDIAKREIPFELNWELTSLMHYDESPLLVNAQNGQSTIDTDTTSTDTTVNTTSIENVWGERLMLYPNPAQDLLHLQMEANHPRFSVSLVDLVGRTQLQSSLPPSQNQLSLNIAHLPAGVYLLQLKSVSQAVISRKVIIE
ncbi:MAG: right-handed parallel beta-helix repeat-containing protein [Bacteroidia bacterium]